MNLTHCLEVNKSVHQNINAKWHIIPKSKLARSIEFGKEDWRKEKRYVFTITSELLLRYDRAKERITEICRDVKNSVAPNKVAQQNGLKTLNILWENRVLPSLINSTGDSSLVFEFFFGNDFYLIEFYNSGEIVYLHRTENSPASVIEIEGSGINDIVTEIVRAYASINMR